ncbi:pyrroline-5-carboxylate reductase [Sporolactobacillus putidus]|uniref:Pyrroline-5-carboxylate reductase n=1 Tax=Sporolactobacillus putidus TaxID=492735 RepID=A0A917S6Z9_9BACL|nr:pyrroline-5-carboxylate reductase [Sporolactobacillus putidus]GGL61302.1 pyrroline-5-carboxylate reductase 2 [Sporolactobacillus putidus]
MLNKIAFIGAGELAESLLKGFLNKNFIRADHVWINNHSSMDRLKYLERTYHVNVTQDKQTALKQAEVVVLAFRPGSAEEALVSMRDYLQTDQLIISLMVGVPSEYIISVAGQSLPVVRVMPNTSASIGLSATGMAAGEFVSREQMDLATELFETVGTVTVVRESDIDVIAGLSGSGPAYLYYLAEAMQEAGIREGISAEASAQLVLQTLSGAVALLNRSGKAAGDLLKAVATPGGTTQAGIDTLNGYRTKEAIIDCVHRAIVRAGEMSVPFSK